MASALAVAGSTRSVAAGVIGPAEPAPPAGRWSRRLGPGPCPGGRRRQAVL